MKAFNIIVICAILLITCNFSMFKTVGDFAPVWYIVIILIVSVYILNQEKPNKK